MNPLLLEEVSVSKPVIAWWSGGADSAVTCWLCIKWFGKDRVRVVFIDTNNEDDDTYRFKNYCSKWYGIDIETIQTTEWDSIQDIWEHYVSLNVATGAICSTELKREVRQKFQMQNEFSLQAFGFDAQEIDRARNMVKNYPDAKPIFPVIYELLKKGDALKVLQKHGVEPPNSYKMGYSNNNCLKTGCVKGGIGYWQKYREDFPERFNKMAELEHKLTDIKGEPVTICKDQSKNGKLVFLLPHPKYPEYKHLAMMRGRKPEPLMECNGFCQVNNHTTPEEVNTRLNNQ